MVTISGRGVLGVQQQEQRALGQNFWAEDTKLEGTEGVRVDIGVRERSGERIRSKYILL